MGDSYRIKTELGINKSINVQLDQEFEFLEILSLKIQQTDIYTRSCADYGVLVGRVTANNGFGLPNARVSIFIPIEQVDESNPLITSIYPYKSPNDKNEDGYRYNLLPYTPSYSKHSATGTLPSRSDVLTGGTAVEIYDKYYRFTSKTNDSGDYMIMGVPLGQQTIVMDVDLSDIGEFSLTPQDLIRIGLATEAQVAGNKFRASSDLNSLPQIINLVKNVEISPLWGDPEICDISINRLDFDLRDDANVDIQPTSVFMGSIFSTEDNFRLRSNRILGNELGCRPRDNMGNLCDLVPGPGQILAIRQTIQQDEDGNPVLEVYELEQAGNVIDGDGTWIVELPMNLDYFITNEFGEKVISSDTTVGIPSKAKYRFKIKWQQSPGLSQQTRRASFLIPNVREYGWIDSGNDPNYSTNVAATNKLKSSYYFGLDWNGYVTGFTSSEKIQKLNEIIDCQDTFYEFKFNRVYTVSNLIDQYKKGGRGRFIGIKEIDDSSCNSTVNKFPANDGFKNFNILFFVFSILMQVIQIISVPLLITTHVVAFIWNTLVKFRAWFVALLGGIILFYGFSAIKNLILGIKKTIESKSLLAQAAVAGAGLVTAALAAFFTIQAINAAAEALIFYDLAREYGIQALQYSAALIAFEVIFRLFRGQPIKGFNLPVITYPDCTSCECGASEVESENSSVSLGTLASQFSNPALYYNNLINTITQIGISQDNSEVIAGSFSSTIGGNNTTNNNNQIYKVMESEPSILSTEGGGNEFFTYSTYIPFGERINNFNLRQKYFNGSNRISVSFDTNLNKHYDNTLILIYDAPLDPGTLLTFVDPLLTRDVNATYTGNTGAYTRGISGIPLNSEESTYNVEYCDPNNQLNNLSVSYLLNTGSTLANYKFPSDVEYFQVLTGITVSEASTIWNTSTAGLLPNIMNSGTAVILSEKTQNGWNETTFSEIQIKDIFESFSEKYILILQRGVDPYSPLYNNKYGLGKLFGLANEDDLSITANTRLNIPIQKLPDNSISVQKFNNQNNIFYPSHFFRGNDTEFSAFTTSLVGYYGAYDALNRPQNSSTLNVNGVNCFVSSTSNDSWSSAIEEPAKYTTSEDLSGGAYYFVEGGREPSTTKITYFTSVLLPSLTANPMSITSRINNVMRTDRLPSSDVLDGFSWDYNPSLLQQNLGFAVYVIDDEGGVISTSNFSAGAEIDGPDIVGQYASSNVFETLNTCSQTVSLGCYEGFGTDFQVNQNCADKDAVIAGCYRFLKRPLLDIGKDVRNFNEWAYRWRFFYGLCQGVLSQSFVNNWINGALYMYPIQINTIFDSQNKPQPPIFCKDVIYFESDTNNFYYRSSPFNEFTNKFVGKLATQVGSLNDLNLQSPTTIINLGMKDSFYNEIILGDGDTGAYVMNQMDSTSYGDPSDLINLFVISRITDEKFLQRIISGKDNGINQLFSRPDLRVDGDLAQLLSINSELGVIKFSPEFYQIVPNQLGPVEVLGTPSNPVVAVWFSSTTEDLQVKDYLTPGRINFRTNDNSVNYPYPYGIKSQVVPFYQWKLTNQNTIFGSELNNWATNYVDLVQDRYYQSQDRTSLETPNYFRPLTSSVSDLYARGYIFSVDAAGGYSTIGASSSRFIVGAPFHFYFGMVKGNSALDKFKTKYSVDE
tara:strand:- start:4295 stop:9220 length:4926 start_codon:yes stop_codon:yes gene_type:complete